MAKAAKKIQTDYTKGGRDVSNTAVPLYQNTLNRIEDYQSDYGQGVIDNYLNKYYSNTNSQNDFLRDYNRAMSSQTGRNYNAMQGGYSSLNNRNYDDLQRYQNDLATALYEQGVSSASNMANTYYNNLLGSTDAYNKAYQLGKEYSDIEQYNNMVKQNNSFWNQLAGLGGTIGTVAGAALTGGSPAGAAIGNSLGSALGGVFQTDTSSILGNAGLASGGSNSAIQLAGLGLAGENAQNAISNALGKFFGGNNANTSGGAAQSWSSRANLQGIGNYGLNTTQPTSGYKLNW